MANAQPKSPAAAAPTPSRSSSPANDNTVDKLTSKMAVPPTKVVTWVIGATAAVLVAWLATHFLSQGKKDKEGEFFDRLQKVGAEPELADRAKRYASVLELAKGTDREAYVLMQQALTFRDAALESSDPTDRLSLFESGLEAVKSLKALGPKALFNTFSPKPPMAGGTPAKLVPQELEDYLQSQVDWLKANPGSSAEVVDANCSATLTLADPEGKEHTLEIAFFSKDAPHSVHTFLAMVNEGRFANTRVFGLQQDDANTEENHAALLGSALSAVAPDRSDLWGGEADECGFTVPIEPNRLAAKKGRIALERRLERNSPVGSQPLSVVLFLLDEANDHDRCIFGEVKGSEELLTKLSSLAANKDKPLPTGQVRAFPPKDAWTIKKATIQGAPATSDPGGFSRIFRAPAVPKSEDAPK